MRMSNRAKRRIIIVAVLLVAAAAGVFVLRQFRQAQAARLAEERKAEGIAAYEAGDYEAALDPLMEAEKIAVMPGESFGAAAAGHLRIALTVADDDLMSAIATLADFHDALNQEAA